MEISCSFLFFSSTRGKSLTDVSINSVEEKSLGLVTCLVEAYTRERNLLGFTVDVGWTRTHSVRQYRYVSVPCVCRRGFSMNIIKSRFSYYINTQRDTNIVKHLYL